jgi:hypothetical protein
VGETTRLGACALGCVPSGRGNGGGNGGGPFLKSARRLDVTVLLYVGEYLVFFRLELVNGLIFCNVHMST